MNPSTLGAGLQATYDEFPYLSYPFPQTHPDALATHARLFGVEPPAIDRCRVLEIGCASGGNLIPVAAALPGSQFVGIDFSPVQVQQGAADIGTLGLSNIRLLAVDIMDFGAELGPFDYIVAHGVYSWVRDEVQEKILAICARQLAPKGVAYISYNTLPGWRLRGMVREAMQYHTRQFADAKSKVTQARAMLDFLAESTQNDTSAYGVMLRSEAEFVRKQPDYYLLHDHLEEVNDPLYFYQFMERAMRHGLRYLSEADFPTMLSSDFAAPVAQTLERIAPDTLKREQFIDFLRNRTFRQTLLVREGVQVTRKVSPQRIMSLRLASHARSAREPLDFAATDAEEFRTVDGPGLRTPHLVTKAAIVALAAKWPDAVPFDDLYADARARLGGNPPAKSDERAILASNMLQCFAARIVELHQAPSPFVIEAGERPAASAVARLQAERGRAITNLRHGLVAIDEETQQLLPLLDGSRVRAAIATTAWPDMATDEAVAKLERSLNELAQQALLVR